MFKVSDNFLKKFLKNNDKFILEKLNFLFKCIVV